MDYNICSIMLKGHVKRKINLDEFYLLLMDKYSVEYNPEVTNRMIIHLPEASVLIFTSGTIQNLSQKPRQKRGNIGRSQQNGRPTRPKNCRSNSSKLKSLVFRILLSVFFFRLSKNQNILPQPL